MPFLYRINLLCWKFYKAMIKIDQTSFRKKIDTWHHSWQKKHVKIDRKLCLLALHLHFLSKLPKGGIKITNGRPFRKRTLNKVCSNLGDFHKFLNADFLWIFYAKMYLLLHFFLKKDWNTKCPKTWKYKLWFLTFNLKEEIPNKFLALICYF